MELVVATQNKDKLKEIKELLRGLNVKISSLKDYPNIPKIKETGKTFKDNALLKALKIAKLTGKLTIADDSGLEVKELRGRPGVRSSRFAGENVTYRDNNYKLLKLLKDVPKSKRSARFVCNIAIIIPKEKTIVIEGSCQGVIGFEPKGKNGFGYDPIFIPKGHRRSFAQLSLKIKNKLSHRAKALQKTRRIIATYCPKRS